MCTWCNTISWLQVTLLRLLLLLREEGRARPSCLLLKVSLLQHQVCFLLLDRPYAFLQTAGAAQQEVRATYEQAFVGSVSRCQRDTSKNLFSCLSCPFSALSCVTTRMASATILVLSVLTSFLGSSALESSAKLQRTFNVKHCSSRQSRQPRYCMSELVES